MVIGYSSKLIDLHAIMRNAWKELGDLSASGAMSAFVSLLDTVCPPFRDFVGEHVQTQRKLAQRFVIHFVNYGCIIGVL
uniref:GLOBIN domain-containing protein n=1 Tax=Ascaris lumbricoides TaxID=6252 RepID=A0A0M3IDN0_ASCLU